MVTRQHVGHRVGQHELGSTTPRVWAQHWQIVESAEVHGTDPRADFRSNDLRDGGTKCTHCGAAISRAQLVRRTRSGGTRHTRCRGS